MTTTFHFLSQFRHVLRAIMLLIFLFFQSTAIPADEENERENKIKIAYLFHFAQFTEWSLKSTNFTYCVYEDGDFSKLLKAAYSDKTLRGDEVNVRLINAESALTANCQLIYFPSDAPQNLLTKMIKKPILTVGNQKNFIAQNGIIYMYEKDQKIRFYINNAIALEAGLKISSQLLALSKDENQ
ncbi:MAG: YfiR family protein [Methylococcaceae bacterium]